MKIKGQDFTVEEVLAALQSEENKTDFEALAGNFKTDITAEGVESFLGTPEGQRLLQPKLDQYHTKSLQSWQEKNM